MFEGRVVGRAHRRRAIFALIGRIDNLGACGKTILGKLASKASSVESIGQEMKGIHRRGGIEARQFLSGDVAEFFRCLSRAWLDAQLLKYLQCFSVELEARSVAYPRNCFLVSTLMLDNSNP